MHRNAVVFRSAGLVVALLMVLGPWLMAAQAGHARVVEMSHGGEVLRLRVDVSYKGFNGHPDFVVEAEPGQEVELTFVWADTAVPDNVHRIYIKGYELKTGMLDAENREQTLRFVADKTGTFEIVCDWRCEGHKETLQAALLKVGDGGTSAGTPSVATRLSLQPSATTVSGEPVTLTATMSDEDGEPIANAPVRFYTHVEFAGKEAPMEIGTAETDESGVASLVYTPTYTGEHQVTARFEGSGLYAESEEVAELEILSAEPAYTVAPKGLEGVRTWAPVGVGLVLLVVWSTIGYVLYQVFRIRTGAGADA